LKEDEMKIVLESVCDGEMSLLEMECELVRIKEMRALENYFVKATACSSWANAKER
jgi:hypothetical protein